MVLVVPSGGCRVSDPGGVDPLFYVFVLLVCVAFGLLIFALARSLGFFT